MINFIIGMLTASYIFLGIGYLFVKAYIGDLTNSSFKQMVMFLLWPFWFIWDLLE